MSRSFIPSHSAPHMALFPSVEAPQSSAANIQTSKIVTLLGHVMVMHWPADLMTVGLCPHATKEFMNPHCAVFFSGNKIARRLSEQGCKVAAWNRDGSKTAALSEAGIAVYHSAADAIAASDILVLMLSDADAIQDVLLSAQQPVDLQNKVVLQMGTIGKFLSEHNSQRLI